MKSMCLLVSFLLIAACTATDPATTAPAPTPPDAAPSVEATRLSWVWILTGPRDAEVTGEARSAAFAGHFANMGRMGETGELLVAGPFMEPRVRDDHRGIFLLATDDLAEARTIADTDPTAQAGVFSFEVEPFRTTAPLEQVGPRHDAAVAAAAAAGDFDEPPMGYHCRAYVLVEGTPAEAAEAALDGASVLFAGRIGDGDGERFLACLDATEAEDARARLPEGEVTWTVMPWFATEEVAHLDDPDPPVEAGDQDA